MADKQIKDFTEKTQLTSTDQFILQESGGVTKKCVATVFNDISYTGGGQIKFPATQNASSDANTLDDYEEGTFTPVVEGGTTAGVGTYGSRNGVYTKIGNIVFINLSIYLTAHTGTGDMLITGLPFTSYSGSGIACNIYSSTLTFSGSFIAGRIPASSNYIEIVNISSGSAISVVAIDGTCTMNLQCSYRVG